MKVLRILKDIKVDDLGLGLELNPLCVTDDICQAIEEIFDSLEDQKRRDKIKKDYCLANNISLIEIPYWELKNLEQFLQLKFNDYLEKE